MKLKDKYNEVKRNFPDSIVLLLSGSFYVTYGMDSLLISYLFSYQIKNDKVGFPIAVLEKVLATLQHKHIHYVIEQEDRLELQEGKNNYFSQLEEAQKFYNNQTMLDSLVGRIRLLVLKDSNNYFKIKEFIDEL